MGDFLGFTFGGVHSSDLGITRVSGGDRYDEALHPEIKDRTAEVPGVNGQYYFGSDFGTRSFDLELAFDHLTETQFRKLRQVFGTKDIKQLIFDERPYKYYMVKIESPIELSYICFDEPKKTVGAARDGVRRITRVEEETVIDEETSEETTQTVTYRDLEQVTPYVREEGTERIYKGEGKISFIAYYPFAKSVYKVLPTGEEESSWAVSSGIKKSTERGNIDIYQDNTIIIYNAGDIETGFRLYLPAAVCSTATTLAYKTDISINTPTAQLVIDGITLKNNEVGVLIDTNSNLIVGVSDFGNNDSYTTNGILYNEYVNSGYFFHLEPNQRDSYSAIEITGGGDGIHIFYDYLYF